MTLLQQRDQARRKRRLQIYFETRQRLKEAIAELIPGRKVIVFGSLVKPGSFNDRSDVDIALDEELSEINSWELAAALMDRLERPVDIVLLDRCRFREKILHEGETWIA